MAAAAGIVVAQDYAAPDSDNRSIKERLNVLQEVRIPQLCDLLCSVFPANVFSIRRNSIAA